MYGSFPLISHYRTIIALAGIIFISIFCTGLEARAQGTGNPPEPTAFLQHGAVGWAVCTASGQSLRVTLNSETGKLTMFAGYSANTGVNSFYFDSQLGSHIQVLVNGPGSVALFAPLRADLNRAGQSFSLIRETAANDAGVFFWGGYNELSASGWTGIDLRSGITHLQSDFQLTLMGKCTFSLGLEHTLSFDCSNRDPEQPFFDFSLADPDSVWSVAPGARIIAPRSLQTHSGRFLLMLDPRADFSKYLPLFELENNDTYQARLEGEPGKLWLVSAYDPYAGTCSIAKPLEEVMAAWTKNSETALSMSETRFRQLRANLDMLALDIIHELGLEMPSEPIFCPVR